METIMRNNINNQDKVATELEIKKLILYNAKKEIFIYSYKKNFQLLSSDIFKGENLKDEIYNRTGINIQNESVCELMTLIDYEKFFITYKNKLKEAYKKKIYKYYSYYIEFDDDILSNLIASSSDFHYEHLDLVSLDELIEYSDREYDKHSLALKKLKSKLEYKEY